MDVKCPVCKKLTKILEQDAHDLMMDNIVSIGFQCEHCNTWLEIHDPSLTVYVS